MEEVRLWWANVYPQLSLKNATSLSIYTRFGGGQNQAEVDGSEEANFMEENGVKQWTLKDDSKGVEEKLIHRSGDDMWSYERRTQSSICSTCYLTTLLNSIESGEILIQSPFLRTIEKWESGATLTYSKSTFEGDSEHRLSAEIAKEGQGGWVEVEFREAGVREYEKVVYGDKENTGEVRHEHGDAAWGETWKRGEGVDEQRSWKSTDKNNRKPGTEPIEQLFEYHWDLVSEGGSTRPLPALPDSPSFPPRPTLSHSLISALSRQSELVQESLSTLEMMLDAFPEHSEEYARIVEEYEAVESWEVQTAEGLVGRLEGLQEVLTKIEKVKRKVGKMEREWVQKGKKAQVELEDIVQFSLDSLLFSPSKSPSPSLHSLLSSLRSQSKHLSSSPNPIQVDSWTSLLKRLTEAHLSAPADDDSALSHSELREAVKRVYGASAMLEAVIVRLSELSCESKPTDDTSTMDKDYTKAVSGSDPQLFFRLLSYLQSRGETALRAVERMKGREQSEVDSEVQRIQFVVGEAIKTPSMPQVRKMVRTTTQSPLVVLNQVLDSFTTSLVPIFSIIHPTSTDVPVLRDLGELQARNPDGPIPHLILRAEILTKVSAITTGYFERINRSVILADKQLSRLLRSGSDLLEDLDGPAKLSEIASEWSERTVRAEGEQLIVDKLKHLETVMKAVRAGVRSLQEAIEELSLNNDEFEELIHQKSEEVVYLTTEIHQLTSRLRERQNELLQLRRFKSENDDNTASLHQASIRIRELELLSSSSPPSPSIQTNSSRCHSLRYILEVVRKRANTERAVLIEEWKRAVCPSDFSDVVLDHLTAIPDTPWITPLETASQAKDWEAADRPLSSIRTSTLRDNPLLSLVTQPGLTFPRTLSDTQFYRCLESIFRAKLCADAHDFEDRVRPGQFSAFFIRYSVNVQGSKMQGTRFIGHLLASVAALYAKKEPYAMFISRMLGVLDPHPASLEAGLIALRYFARVSALRTMTDCDMSVGGRVSLAGLLDECFAELSRDPHLCQVWLERCKPAEMTEEVFGFTLVSMRIATLGLTIDDFIAKIPTPIERTDLQTTLKDELSLILPKGVLTAVWNSVKSEPVEAIGKALTAHITERSSDGEVRVADCLHGILDAIETKRKRISWEIVSKSEAESYSRESLMAFLCALDPEETQNRVLDLVEQIAEGSQPEPYSIPAIVRVVATSPLKCMRNGVLEVGELGEELDRRTEETLFDLLQSVDVPGKRTRLIRSSEVILRTKRVVLKSRRSS